MAGMDPLAAYNAKFGDEDARGSNLPATAAPSAPADPLYAYNQRMSASKVVAPKGGKGDSAAGAAMAFTEHAGNQLSLGYLPHIQAALGPDIDKTIDLITGQDVSGSSKLSKIVAALSLTQPNEVVHKILSKAFLPDKEYIAARDENIQRLDQERKDYPGSSLAGDVTGIGVGALATAGMGTVARAPQGASFLTRAAVAGKNIGTAATRGAIQAGLYNPGDVQGQAGGLQLDDRIANAKRGALIGAAVQGAFETAPLIKAAVKTAGAKLASTLSGETEEIVSNYANKTDQINQMIKKSGGDVSQITDQARERLQGAIRTYRQGLGGQISKALDSASQEASIPNQPILDALETAKKGLNPVYKQEAIDQIDGIIQKIKAGSTRAAEGAREGFMSPAMLNEAKEYLQEQAKSAYMRGGQIFQNSKEAAQAARSAAAIARKALNEAVPEVAQANNQLSALHILEDRLNPNLIAPGASDSAFLAAGAGRNPRNARMLDRLGQLTGIPALETARDAATARAFANPGWLPTDVTGKAAARVALAAGAGHLLGPTGYVLGAAASPAAVKLAINAGNSAGKLAGGLPAVSQAVSSAAQPAAGFSVNAAAAQLRGQGGLKPPPKDLSDDDKIQAFFRENPDMLRHVQDQGLRQAITGKVAKGENLWAHNGLSALEEHGAGISGVQAEAMLRDPEGKRLLIRASNLKPGSKAMDQIVQQIQNHLKGAQ